MAHVYFVFFVEPITELHSVGPAVGVLFLLIHPFVQMTASNTEIVSHEEFSGVRNSVLRSIQTYLTQNINLTLCTQIFINNGTDNLFIPEGMPYVIVSNIWPLNKPTRVLQHSSQCTVVTIVNAINVIDSLDEHWLKYIPGTFFNSFHFILAPDEILDWIWDRPFVRRLANVVAFVDRGEKIWDLLTSNRYNGKPRYFHVGEFNKGTLKLTSEKRFFWNKWWNMEGLQLKVAMPPSLSEEAFRLQAEGKMLLYGVTEVVETVRYLNSTPQVISMPVTSTKFPNGSWDGVIGNVIDDTVDITYPYFPNPELYAAVFISKPALCSQVKFFTPLPKKAGFTLNFLTKPLDTAIWTGLFLCVIASASVVYVLKMTDDREFVHKLCIAKLLPHRLNDVMRICSYFIRILIDQSMPSSAINFLDRIVGSRWVFIAWFLATTVVGCCYKSVVVSILVKPSYIDPPQTISELIKSDFQVNIPMYKSSMKEYLSWKDQLAHPIKEFGFDFRGCLRTLLEGNNVCLFLHHWLYLTAPLELTDQFGNQLYLVSSDAINSISNSFYISQRNPQLKSAIDIVVCLVTEGGLQARWIRQTYYNYFLRTVVRKRRESLPEANSSGSEKADITFMQYPMVVLIGGYLLALCCHIYLYLRWWYLKPDRMIFLG